MNDYSSLVTQAQSEDRHHRADAFNQLFLHFQPMAYNYAYSSLGDSYMAEDVTQDAFLTVYQRIGQLRDPLAFPGWLKRIVMTHVDRLIRKKRPPLESFEARYDLADDESPDPETTAEENDLKDRLKVAIDSLPEHERVVTEGFYVKGESQKEIADRLNIPIATVKKRLQYARQRLKGLVYDLNVALTMLLIGLLVQPIFQPAMQPAYAYAAANVSQVRMHF